MTEHSPANVDERAIIVDRDNHPVNVVPRSVMRAEGLRHRATAIFVVDRAGRLFVQPRTDTKDIAPGMLDLCAGGVVVDGESYENARWARRRRSWASSTRRWKRSSPASQ